MTTRYVTVKKGKESEKRFHAEFKSVDTKSGMIEGFASTSFKDRHGDIVEPDAFKDSMSEFLKNPVLLLEHSESIGTVEAVEVVPNGIKIVAKVGKGFEPADTTRKKIDQGILKAFSIGFIPEDVVFDEKRDAWAIKKGELLEVSVVAIPANRQSLFSVIKGYLDGDDTIESIKPSAIDLSLKAIKAEIFRLEQIWKLSEPAQKLELELLRKRLDTLFESEMRGSLLDECLEASRQALMASLR